MAIRDPLGPPAQREIRLYGIVDILHPGYEERCIQLPALDPVDTPKGEPQRGGVNLRLALDACRVLTNNCEGFLSEGRNGDNPVQVSESADSELLVQSQYYYHLAGHLGSMYSTSTPLLPRSPHGLSRRISLNIGRATRRQWRDRLFRSDLEDLPLRCPLR